MTVLGIVPTVLSTIDSPLPDVRLLVVGGEACSQDLVHRWARPGTRMLNTYGPTEATITTTWVQLDPSLPVTIGAALPCHEVHLLDGELDEVAPGEVGEICIGGDCVSPGYLNRPELTEQQFVVLGRAARPTTRVYRSGDLGRLGPRGEIEYLGRKDTQVKLRGYRIELGEIEAVCLRDPNVMTAAVSVTAAVDGETDELVAYVAVRDNDDSELTRRLSALFERSLPAYMMPSFVERVDEFPRSTSGKIDRASLPRPTSDRLSRAHDYIAPTTPLEATIAAHMATVFGVDRVSTGANFFLDLGGHSLFAARLLARLRAEPQLAALSIADLYSSPTVAQLAMTVERSHSEMGATAPCRRTRSAHASDIADGRTRPRRGTHLLAGLSQLFALFVLTALFAAPIAWLLASSRGTLTFELLEAVAVVPVLLFAESVLLPVLGGFALVRGVRPGTYALWGTVHLRLWANSKLQQLSPLPLMSGSPLAAIYLRWLGASVGSGVTVATGNVQLPHLCAFADHASVGYGADLRNVVLTASEVRVGRIELGRHAHVGTNASVLAGASLDDGAELGEQSALEEGVTIPAGARVVGSPGVLTEARDPIIVAMREERVETRAPSWLLPVHVLCLAALYATPFVAALPAALLVAWMSRAYGVAGALAGVLLAGPLFVACSCAFILLAKRVLVRRVAPGIYPVASAAGTRKWIADQAMQLSLLLTNSLYGTLYTAPWLRSLGARVGTLAEVSTVAHVDPDLLTLEDGCFVADIASLGAATYCDGRVATGPTHVGARAFVGNSALVSGYSTIGAGSLLGVASTTPASRVIEPATSWLGSPAIFLPARQHLDGFDEIETFDPTLGRRAARRSVEWFRLTLPATLLFLEGATAIVGALWVLRHLGVAALLVILPALLLASGLAITLVVVALKWLLVGRYQRRVAALWSHFVWRSELVTGLYESVATPSLLTWIAGTPMLPWVIRLFGAHVGEGVVLETTFMTEFDLVHIGDRAVVGPLSDLQTHLFEDRVMKMAPLHVGEASTVGSRCVVLYDAHVEDGAELGALSLAMKGETVPAGGVWQGIPARHT